MTVTKPVRVGDAKAWRHIEKYEIAIPDSLIGVWISCGGGFQQEYDISSDDGCDALLYWWIRTGRFEFEGIKETIDRWICEDMHFSHLRKIALTTELTLTPLQNLIHRHRPDLQAAFDLDTADGGVGFWNWWRFHGLAEYIEQSDWTGRMEAHLLLGALQSTASVLDRVRYQAVQMLQLPESNGPTAGERAKTSALFDAIHFDHIGQPGQNSKQLSPLMSLIHRNRPGLQAKFDLDTAEGHEGFWNWWRSRGVVEYIGNRQWIERKEARLLLGAVGSAADSLDGVRYQALQTLLSPASNGATADERAETGALFGAIHFSHIGQPDQNPKQPSPLMALIHRHRPDLQAAFDPDTAEGREGFWNWWQSFGLTEYPIASPENVRPSTEMSGTGTGPAASITPSSPAGGEGQSSKAADDPGTISLVGYPRGEFGLGEDIRLVRSSLRTAGIEPEVIKAPWNIIARQTIDEQAEEADAADFNSDVMLYVMPAFDTLTLLNKVGPRAFNARRKIGYWQWELARFPEPAKIAFDLVDEIWCHSEHSAKAFRSATEKPVTKVPLPVLVPEIKPVPRSHFGFNDGDYIVFSSFDGASSISRKNPMGVILAFQQAFPRKSGSNARLIVKAMNTIDDALWRDCLRKAALDDRICIFNRVLDRNEYYELLQCCDVVLSLHRAEGFGRVMAEAMAIGIPAIASGYSGNLDFMNADNSWLVPGELSPLIAGDYPFHQGQEWLEPDVGEAAKALRECFENEEKRARLVENAKATIDRYSPANCGKIYAELLTR